MLKTNTSADWHTWPSQRLTQFLRFLPLTSIESGATPYTKPDYTLSKKFLFLQGCYPKCTKILQYIKFKLGNSKVNNILVLYYTRKMNDYSHFPLYKPTCTPSSNETQQLCYVIRNLICPVETLL
jgi:hypothetical protein